MTANPQPTQPATDSLWTIARIHEALPGPVMIRRFLLDITHAPEHQVMNVFAAWQRVAATIEASTAGPTSHQQASTEGDLPSRAPATDWDSD